MQSVEMMSHDAMKKRGKFRTHFSSQSAMPSGHNMNAYVVPHPNSQFQYVAPVNAKIPSASHTQGSAHHCGSEQCPPSTQVIQPMETPPQALPSSASTTKYHTSPSKSSGSPKTYVLMGPGGGYYHQYAQE